MTLSKRLLTVCSFVPEGSFIADVGSDHAQVPLFLLGEKQISGAQAIENKKGPFLRMKKAVEESPYASKIHLSYSDGLTALEKNVDCVILAGLGGRLIARILLEGKSKLFSVRHLVVDCHEERAYLIPVLGKLGFAVEESQFLFEDGIAYDVMKLTQKGHSVVYSERESRFGPLNLVHPNAAWISYWTKEKNRLESLLGLPELPAKRRETYAAEIAEIKEVLPQ